MKENKTRSTDTEEENRVTQTGEESPGLLLASFISLIPIGGRELLERESASNNCGC